MFTRKEEVKPHVPARVRAYGRARIEIAQRAQTRQEWDELWKPPSQPFAFDWGPYWKHCIEYKVEDFSAEVGFFIDLLGLPVNAFNENYAMFTSPDHEFYFAVVPADKAKPTPADGLRIQFMVADIFKTTEKLQQRGIQFVQQPLPVSEGSNQWVASFQTPNGISLEIWGVVETQISPAREVPEEEDQKPIEMEEKPVPIKESDESRPESYTNWMTRLNSDGYLEDEDETEDDEDDYDWLEESEDSEDEQEALVEKSESIHTQPQSKDDPDDLESASPRYAPAEQPHKVVKPQPIRTFQTAEEMLNSLNQKKTNKPADPQPLQTPAKSTEKAKLTFSPAPKKADEKKLGSVWDTVDVEQEYVDLEKPVNEDYHYTPLPLKRDR